MTLQKLSSQLALLEGKRSQVSIGNLRETLKCLCTLEAAYRVKTGDASNLGEIFITLDLHANKIATKALKKAAKNGK